jgi:hypothetical protein
MSKVQGIQQKVCRAALGMGDIAERRYLVMHIAGLGILFALLYLKWVWLPAASPLTPYWYWLKPMLMLAESIPILFFIWSTVRAYQFRYHQMAWTMELMGAAPDDIASGIYYRGMFVAMLSALLGSVVCAGLSCYVLQLPIISIWLSIVMMSISGVMGWAVAALACRYPPDWEPLSL